MPTLMGYEEIRERVKIPVDEKDSADVVGSNPTGPTTLARMIILGIPEYLKISTLSPCDALESRRWDYSVGLPPGSSYSIARKRASLELSPP